MKIIIGFLILGLSLPCTTYPVQNNGTNSYQTQKPEQSFWEKYKVYFYETIGGIAMVATLLMFNARRSANSRKELARRISTTNDPWVLQNLSNSVERNIHNEQSKEEVQEMITEQLGSIKRQSGKPGRG